MTKLHKSTKHQTLNQLATWFKNKSVDELSDIIMGYVVGSENELSKWQLAMLNDQGNVDTIEIKAMIDKALPEESAWTNQEMHDYFYFANNMFEEIFVAIDRYSVDTRFDLILYSLTRLNKVLEDIHDSSSSYVLEDALKKQLIDLFELLSWSDEQKAQWIFDHYKSNQYMVFPELPKDFELTDNCNDIFISLCISEANDTIETGVDLSHWKEKNALEHILNPLIAHSKAANNWQHECRLMAMTAYNVNDFIRIGTLYLEHDSPLDAEHWLQQAYQAANDVRDKNACKHFEVTLRLELKEYQQAWQIAWQLFTQQPSFSGYKELIALEQITGVIDADFSTKTEQVLNDCYAETHFGGIVHNADALLQFYIYHNELDKARAWVLSHNAQPEYLIKLADLIVTNYPQAAADLYSRVVNVMVGQGKNRAYQEATNLLLKLDKAFKNIDDISINPVIYKVIHQHKAKRNMMTLLKTHFGQCF